MHPTPKKSLIVDDRDIFLGKLRPDQARIDQLAQLLSKTEFCWAQYERAARILEIADANGQGQLKISIDDARSSWQRVLEQANKFMELEAELWTQSRLSREREDSSHRRYLRTKQELDSRRVNIRYSAEDNCRLFRTVNEQAFKIESYTRIIKYLHRELKAIRKKHNVQPYGTLQENSMVNNIRTVPYSIYSSIDSIQGYHNMTEVLDIQQHIRNKNKGMDTSITPPENWLKDLEDGTHFVCGPLHPQDPNPLQHEYVLVSKTEKTVKLLSSLNDPEIYVRVDPNKFCAIYSLVEVIAVERND